MEAQTTTWIVTMVCVALFTLALWWVVRLLWRVPTMRRCPETGSVAFVRVAKVAQAEGREPSLAVAHCDLWPDRKDCAQGCLGYPDTAPGGRVELNSLRPFEPR
jgi:hypothetical protein